MKNKMSILIAGLLVALLVVGVVGASGVIAQASASADTSTDLHGRGPGGGRGLGQVELEAAAKVLNITADELSTALQGGKTLEQIATDANVDFARVQEAIRAAHATELRTRIQQAVTDGTITQENADWLLEGIDKGFIGVPGAFGLGGPHGGHGGFGDGTLGPDGQQTTPQVQPTQSSGG